jgi:hypothetical protein
VVVVVAGAYRDLGARRYSECLLQKAVAHRRLMVEDWKKQKVRRWE